MIPLITILLVIAGMTAAYPDRFKARAARTGRRLAFMAGYVLETLRPLPVRKRGGTRTSKQNDRQ